MVSQKKHMKRRVKKRVDGFAKRFGLEEYRDAMYAFLNRIDISSQGKTREWAASVVYAVGRKKDWFRASKHYVREHRVYDHFRVSSTQTYSFNSKLTGIPSLESIDYADYEIEQIMIELDRESDMQEKVLARFDLKLDTLTALNNLEKHVYSYNEQLQDLCELYGFYVSKQRELLANE